MNEASNPMNPDECNNDLKPCPFCGQTKHLYIEKQNGLTMDVERILCTACDLTLRRPDHVIEHWNSRTESKLVTPEAIRDVLWKQDHVHIKLSEAIDLAGIVYALQLSGGNREHEIKALTDQNAGLLAQYERDSNTINDLRDTIANLKTNKPLSDPQSKVTWEGDDIMTALICSAMQNIWEAEGAPTETRLKKSLDTALDRLRAALQLCTPEPLVALGVDIPYKESHKGDRK